MALPRTALLLRVPDARYALGLLAAAFYGQPAGHLKVLGITGTNGKTTVAAMLRALFSSAGRTTGLLGTIEHIVGQRRIPSGHTTPDAPRLQELLAAMRTAECSTVVMEVSSHALHQQRVAGIDFDLGLFTNLSRDHLDYHPDMAAYAACKRKLFEGLGAGEKQATAVACLDDPRGAAMLEACPAGVLRLGYGEHPAAAVRAQELALEAAGASCRVSSPWGGGALSIRLPGRFNLLNALGALAAGGAMGLPLEGMLAALASFPPVRGRLEPVPNALGLRVLVDYAHTPDALENVLRSLRETSSGGRVWVVFGCGGDRDRGKRPQMAAAAARWADRIILTSDNPRSEDPADIIADILMGLPGRDNVTVAVERSEAIAAVLRSAAAGDSVLIAGKGHETYQQWGRSVRPFDDREEARRLLEELAHA